MSLKNKTVLITGGTGSLGNALAELLLTYPIKKLIILSRDELKQFEMSKTKFSQDPRIRFLLGDVRDLERLRLAFRETDYIIHAAALKRIDLAEHNPYEYVRTNIIGTEHVVRAALDSHTKKVLLVSTDKACNPANLYGATKLAAEKIIIASNELSGSIKTKFSCVRYGNVLGSRGSVLPYYQELIKSGTKSLPITHPDMTRFWITLPDAAKFVLDSLHSMQGREIFVPRLPTIKMVDLATVLLGTYHIIGIRPGEKIHETLITSEEARRTQQQTHDDFIIFQKEVDTPLITEYTSDQPNHLTQPQIKGLLSCQNFTASASPKPSS